MGDLSYTADNSKSVLQIIAERDPKQLKQLIEKIIGRDHKNVISVMQHLFENPPKNLLKIIHSIWDEQDGKHFIKTVLQARMGNIYESGMSTLADKMPELIYPMYKEYGVIILNSKVIDALNTVKLPSKVKKQIKDRFLTAKLDEKIQFYSDKLKEFKHANKFFCEVNSSLLPYYRKIKRSLIDLKSVLSKEKDVLEYESFKVLKKHSSILEDCSRCDRSIPIKQQLAENIQNNSI